MDFDHSNQEMENAYQMAIRTRRSFFLTGRAGSGKTTFLKAIQKESTKRFVVLAPTGVAAINAGGQTIHSFFGFGFGVQGPEEIGKLNSSKIDVIKHIDSIIIDEVSMVRCDIIDGIDRTLRYYLRSSDPFGGIQMIFVGDLFQLEPIAKPGDKKILKEIYGTEECYFYNSKVIKSLNLPKIEFLKIYRQSDTSFIHILDHFRTGKVTYSDLALVNSRVAKTSDKEYQVTLTSYVRDADLINETRLAALDGDIISFEAEYEGDVNKCRDIAEPLLRLKKGAQVMFIKNDCEKRWYNGTIAKISDISEEGIVVAKENGDKYVLDRESWDVYEYEYDKIAKKCNPRVVGRVTQYPIRLAWAITIHKSQSLSFDHLAIDFGWGAFSNGQTYVALSRARSLEGLELIRPITYRSVKVSRDVLRFSSSYNDRQQIELELTIGEAENEYITRKDIDGAALKLFQMSKDEAAKGRIAFAYELFNRSMSYVINDSCLNGQQWDMIPSSGLESNILNAAGLFYSGKPSSAYEILKEHEHLLKDNFSAQYIKARICRVLNNKTGFLEAYYQMTDLYRSSIDNGIDSPAFKKFRYLMSTEGFDKLGEDGLQIVIKLIRENPEYLPLYVSLKHIVNCNGTESDNATINTTNPLVTMIHDRTVSKETFLECLRTHHKEQGVIWSSFQNHIKKMA